MRRVITLTGHQGEENVLRLHIYLCFQKSPKNLWAHYLWKGEAIHQIWKNICYEKNAMKRKFVSSSTMKSAGHDAGKRILEIEFTSGEVYRYFDVPVEIFSGLMNAESKGKYFNHYIGGGEFDFIKIS